MDECYFTKSNTPPWVFSHFHLCKWYQIAQSITNESGDTNLSMLNQDGDQTLTDDDHGQK